MSVTIYQWYYHIRDDGTLTLINRTCGQKKAGDIVRLDPILCTRIDLPPKN